MSGPIRIIHGWYDGPIVGVAVEVCGVWVPYGRTSLARQIEDALPDDADPADWPEGIYRLMGGQLVAE